VHEGAARAAPQRLPRRRSRDGSSRVFRHDPDRGIGAFLPSRRLRPDPGPCRPCARAQSLDARRCLRRRFPGTLRAPPRIPDPALRLCGRRRAVDVGGPAQIWLCRQGGVRDAARRPGAAPAPRIRVRQLAAREVRGSDLRGLPPRWRDCRSVGGDALPRHRGLHEAGAQDHGGARGSMWSALPNCP
jgi:hypothetical protein